MPPNESPTYKELEQQIIELKRFKKEPSLEHDQQYRELFNDMPEMFQIIELIYDDTETVIDYYYRNVNTAFEKLVSKTRNQLIGKRAKDLFGIVEDYSLHIYEEVCKTGESKNFENYGADLKKYYDVYAWKVGKEKVAAIFKDITKRKQEELKLNKAKNRAENSEKNLEKAQKATQVGSWYLDIASNEVTWSKELYKMYGFDPKLPVPPYPEHQKLFTPESWELLSVSLSNTSKTDIPYELELRTIRADGSNGWMWVRGETIGDKENKTVGLWGVAQDISERKKLELDLILANKRTLQNKEKEKRAVELAIRNKELIIQNEEKEKSEIELFQSEKRLNQAQLTAKIGSWNFDLQTYKLIWSQEHYRIFELEDTPPEKLYDAYRGKIHPDDISELDRLIKYAIETGLTYEYEHRILCKDGSIKYILGIGKTTTDINGNAITIQGTAQDISQKKLIQKSLDHKTEKVYELNNALNQAQKLSHVGSWQLDITTDKAEWSDEMYNIYGVNKDTFYPSNENVRKTVLPADLYKVDQGIKSLFVDKMFVPFEFRIQRPSGEIRNLYIISLEKDSKENIFGVIKDITERKEAERERFEATLLLERTEKQLIEAQKLANIGSWLFNTKNQKSKWSEEMFHIWDFDLKNGPPDFGVVVKKIHLDDLKLYHNSIENASIMAVPYDIEFRINLQNDVQKIVRSICKPVLGDTGKVVGLSGTNQDITSQKLFEEAQIKHQRLKAIGEMSASIAHDFNNSLQQMMGNLEIVKIQNELPENTLDRLNSIGTIIADISDRVSVLQKFGDTAHDHKTNKRINFNTLIKESLKESRPLWKDGMEKEGLSLTVTTEFKEVPEINCNTGELKSVLYNLIKNSVEAMPKGGKLLIKTGIKPTGVFATFTDTGIGMDKETRLKIFQPFFSTKGFQLGRGLGMSGAYSIIKKYRGDIVVASSNLNKGTTIEIIFPISQ